jgi:NAD+ kinase
MATMFKKVAILGRHEDPRVSEPITVLANYLTQAGVEVLASADMTLEIVATRMPESDLADTADLIIAIGGDGAMLYAGQLARRGDVPLLGINRGRLGFLADVTPEEMLDSVGHVLAGEFTTDKRLVLEARLERPDEEDTTALALNDVVLQRRETGRMLDFVTRVSGRFVNTHAGDGLVIATPTGSTAYSLSCGGPIIEPRLDAVVVVPVAPHTLSDRPIVIPAGLGIELRLLERENTKAEIMADGHSMGEIRPQDRLLVAASETRLTLLHPPGYDFFGILRSKLHWGHDSRKRDIPPEDNQACS